MSVRDFTQGILDRAQRRILDMKPGVLNKAARAAYYGLLVPPVLLARGAAAVAPVVGAAAVLTVEAAAVVSAANARARFECDLCTDHVDCYRCHCCRWHCDCDVADVEIVLWNAPRPRRHFVLFP
jgi:hypothetical protein